MELKKDDIIFLVSAIDSHCSYSSFFKDNGLDIDIAARYSYFEYPKTYEVYRVLFVDYSRKMACIESIEIGKRVYIIGGKGAIKIGTLDSDYEEKIKLFFDCCVEINDEKNEVIK